MEMITSNIVMLLDRLIIAVIVAIQTTIIQKTKTCDSIEREKQNGVFR